MSAKDTALMYKMKVAVAMACLRNKPAGVSGEEYARRLCDQFQTCQLRSKQQLERSEREMLHLRQQLAMCQHQQAGSQPLDDSSLSDSQLLFPTPPPSGNPDVADHTQQDLCETSTSLTRHMDFLRHVITLQTGSKLITDKKMENLAHLSLLHSLELLTEMHDGNDYVWRLQAQCVDCLEKLVKQASPQFRSELIEKTAKVAGQIIHRLACNTTLTSKVRIQQSSLITQMGKIPAMNGQILDKLTVAISQFSDHLRNCLTLPSSLNPAYYSQIYVVLDTADRCLDSETVAALDIETRERLVQRLEDCGTFLCDTFPLFTLAVWRLCCKLSS